MGIILIAREAFKSSLASSSNTALAEEHHASRIAKHDRPPEDFLPASPPTGIPFNSDI